MDEARIGFSEGMLEVGREWPPMSPRDGYDAWTRHPIFYYPVTRRDKLLGYWAGRAVTAVDPSTVRRSPRSSWNFCSFLASVVAAAATAWPALSSVLKMVTASSISGARTVDSGSRNPFSVADASETPAAAAKFVQACDAVARRSVRALGIGHTMR